MLNAPTVLNDPGWTVCERALSKCTKTRILIARILQVSYLGSVGISGVARQYVKPDVPGLCSAVTYDVVPSCISVRSIFKHAMYI